VLAPLPVLIALRGVASALAIARGDTGRVAIGAVVRLIALAAGLAFAARLDGHSPARAAGAALVVGCALETLWLGWPHRGAFARAAAGAWRPVSGTTASLATAEIAQVATPLALAMLVWTAVRPVVHAVLGRLPEPDVAQASFGVVLPVLLVTCSPLWALQDVSLVWARDRAGVRRVIAFATATSALFSLALAALAWTPAGAWLLRLGFDLAPALERQVVPALAWLVLVPPILAARAVAHGLLTRAGRTGPLLVIAPLKIALMLGAGLALAAWIPGVNPAVLALGLVVGGDLFDAAASAWVARALVGRGAAFAGERADAWRDVDASPRAAA
jgi:hypothetical protein